MSDGRKRLVDLIIEKKLKKKNEKKKQEAIRKSKKINSFFMSKNIDNT